MGKWMSLAVVLGASMLAEAAQAAPFTPGDLAVFQAAASASNTTGSIVEIDRTTPAQSPVQTIVIDGSFRVSGSATSTLYVSHTDDRSLLTFNGAVGASTGNVNTFLPRSVATLDANGVFTLQTSYTGITGNQTRSATSLNNTAWFIADQGGMYSNNTTAPDPAGNQRGAKAFGGIVYVGRASATLPTVSTINTPTAGTIVGLPGLPNGTTSFQDFYLIQSGSSGSAYDVLYVLSATSNTVGTLEKYSLVGGSWTSNGTFTTNFGGFGLAAAPAGGAATLFVTTGQGAATANSVVRLSDNFSYNAPITIDPTVTTLFTAPAGTILKGIDFAPVAAVTEPRPVPLLGPLALGVLACGLLAAAASRGRHAGPGRLQA
jgi:hypothetical protein